MEIIRHEGVARLTTRSLSKAVGIAQPSKDTRGPVDFRKSVAGVMVRRAIEAAAKRAR